jgi:replicative DNA helicase
MRDPLDLPYSQEAEVSVLGAVLLDPQAMDAAAELQEDAFLNEQHQPIFAAMLKLYREQKAIDLVTLATELKAAGGYDRVGGMSYLTKLAKAVPTAANIGYYVQIVRDKHIQRQIMTSGQMFHKAALMGETTSETLAQMQQTVQDLQAQAAPKQKFKTAKDVARTMYERVEEMSNNPNRGGITGIGSGFADLDRMTAGFQPSDLIILAARPSMGKTAFALNIAQNVAVRGEKNVAIYSLEMSEVQLMQRMVCAEANLDASRVRTGDLNTDDDWTKMTIGIAALSEAPLFINDTPGISIHEIMQSARELKREHGLDMIIIDYLQLITSGRRTENRQQEVSEISRLLKQLARELEVPVIALSQLSRAVEQRQDKRPMMSDLRESGSIEQDADIVAFLYRDSYYNADTEKKEVAEIIISKQRNGPTGTVELVFLKQFNKFVNYHEQYA